MKSTIAIVLIIIDVISAIHPLYIFASMTDITVFELILYTRWGNSFWKLSGTYKGHLDSESIYEVIVSPKMPTKNLKDFCPTLK